MIAGRFGNGAMIVAGLHSFNRGASQSHCNFVAGSSGAVAARWRALVMACAVTGASQGIAMAQVVERNLPPEPPRRAPTIQIGGNDLLLAIDQHDAVLQSVEDRFDPAALLGTPLFR